MSEGEILGLWVNFRGTLFLPCHREGQGQVWECALLLAPNVLCVSFTLFFKLSIYLKKKWKKYDLSTYGSIWHTPQILHVCKYFKVSMTDIQAAWSSFCNWVVLVCTLTCCLPGKSAPASPRAVDCVNAGWKHLCVNRCTCHLENKPALPSRVSPFVRSVLELLVGTQKNSWSHFTEKHFFLVVTLCFMEKPRWSPNV